MKKLFKHLIILITLSATSNAFSQDLAYNNVNHDINSPKKSTTTSKALEDGNYFYSKNTNKVLVEIKGDTYTEYHPNNEFVKAKIKWTSSSSYKLIITEINKPNLPFKKGTELKTEIVKKKGKKFYYKSELAKRNWTGKLIKVSN